MKNSKRKIISFALAIVLCLSLGVNAFAAEPGAMVTQSTDKLEVRVNGHLTQFPDAQPYIDENSRTLIPLRFVTEALGADVSWNQSAKIASVEKNGIRCDITIGSKAMAVTKDGKVDTVMMDTQAVLKDSRTFVPIRYVAEALGAYVDYSNYYRTVGIWQSVFTPEQIEYLQSLPIDYKMHLADSTQSFVPEYSGGAVEGRTQNGFESFATAREYVYRHLNTDAVNFNIGQYKASTEGDAGKMMDYFLEEAKLYMETTDRNVNPYGLNVGGGNAVFYTDPALVYQPNINLPNEFAVRGIIVFVDEGANETYYLLRDVRIGRDEKQAGAVAAYYSEFAGSGLFTAKDVPFSTDNLSAN